MISSKIIKSICYPASNITELTIEVDGIDEYYVGDTIKISAQQYDVKALIKRLEGIKLNTQDKSSIKIADDELRILIAELKQGE